MKFLSFLSSDALSDILRNSMKKIIALLLFPFFVLFAQNGEELFDMKCAVCHIKTRPTSQMKDSLIAPPINGIVKNLKQAFGDNKDATLEFIVSYTLEPSLEKAKCKTDAIQRFGVMPSQKESVTQDELKSIANYMYANFPLQR